LGGDYIRKRVSSRRGPDDSDRLRLEIEDQQLHDSRIMPVAIPLSIEMAKFLLNAADFGDSTGDSTARAFPASLAHLTRATKPFCSVARALDGPGWNRTTARSFEGCRSIR
jgi:hypothetical protein